MDGVVDQKEMAVVRVFEMLMERMARIEDGVCRVTAYLGQRAEELPRGSEFGAELGPEGAESELRLIKSYDGRFDRAADLFLVDAPFAMVKTGETRVHTPEWASGAYRVWEDRHVEAAIGLKRVRQIRARVLKETRKDRGVHVTSELVGVEQGLYWESLGGYWRRTAIKHIFPEVIAVSQQMLVDLSKGTESERLHTPLQQLYRVVQRVKSELENGHGGSREPDASAGNALEVHTVPRYAGGVAVTDIEVCVSAAAAECRDSEDPRVADYYRRLRENIPIRPLMRPHPMWQVWDEMRTV